MVTETFISDLPPSDDPIIKQILKEREECARNQKKDYSHVFRHKSRLDFVRLSCIVVGIELAYSAETAFVAPILLQIGIEHKHMTMVWGLSPLIGFFLAPLMGSISDRCRLKLGRRRPIIIILSFGMLAGLILVPHGKDIGVLLGDVSEINYYILGSNITNITMTENTENINFEHKNYLYAVIFTILGTILLDLDADTCQTPSRAYLLDVCVPQDHGKALSTFTIMAGLGGTAGYALGAVDWDATKIGSFLGGNTQTVFFIVTVIFLITFLITVTSFREIPLGLIEENNLLRPLSAAAIKKYIENSELNIKKKNEISSDIIKSHEDSVDNKKDTTITISPAKSISVLTLSTNSDEDNEGVSLAEYMKSILIMPTSMHILSLTNLLCWMGHLCYCLYFTDFVGEAVFKGSPTAPFDSAENTLYLEGVRFGCLGMSIYALSCSMYSMVVEKLIKLLGMKTVYMGGIMVFAGGMLTLAIWPTKLGVLLLSSTAGIIYATLFTIPYILVAKYHAEDCFKVKEGKTVELKQTRGLGTDIAIISSMVFTAQLLVSMTVGPLVEWIGSTAAVLYAASGLSLCAAISAINVLYLD